jgi:TolA-binding protein
MKKLNIFLTVLLMFFLAFPVISIAQKTAVYNNPLAEYKSALELFNKQKFSAAEKQFANVIAMVGKEQSELKCNSEYYIGLCALELFNADAEYLTLNFIKENAESPKVNNAYFQLARYEFRNKNYTNALSHFNSVNTYELNNVEKSEYNFKKGYCLFQAEDYVNSKKCFYEVTDKESKYYAASNYYYAHVAYTEKNYETALEGFKKILKDPNYGKIAPYYITQIYYLQGKYDDLLAVAPGLLDSASPKRIPEIARMIGDAYYKTAKYTEAIPYLEMYKTKTSIAITRDDEYQLAYAYYKAPDYIQAIDYFKKVIVKTDDSIAQLAFYNLADCYVKTSQKQFALTSFDQAYKMDFDKEIKESSLFNYGKLAFETSYNPYNDAINAFQVYIKDYPKSKHIDEAYEYLSDMYLSTRNYKDALISLESIKNRDPKLNSTYQKVSFYRGVEVFNNASYNEAIVLFDKSLKFASDNNFSAQALYWKAESFYRNESYDSSLMFFEDFQKTLGAYDLPVYNLSNYNIGYCYFKKKNYGLALTSYRKFITGIKSEKAEIQCDAYMRAGDCFFMLKDYNSSIEYYDKAIKLKKLDTDYGLYQKSLALGVLGRFESKASTLNEIISSYKTSVYADDALFELGNTYQTLAENRKAVETYDKLVSMFPGSIYTSQAMLKTGLIYFNEKNDEMALKTLKGVVSKFPGTAESKEALVSIKNVYVDMDNTEEFFKYAKDLPFANISSDEQDSITYIAIENRYMNNDCENAVKGFREYIIKFPNGAFITDAYFYKAECDYKAGRTAEALLGYDNVVNKPKSKYTEKALLNAGTINFDLKDYNKAIEYYQKLEAAAEYRSNITIARTGTMRSYYALNDFSRSIASAFTLISTEKLDDEMKAESYLIIAKSALSIDSIGKAIYAFDMVTKTNKGEMAAEAKYNLAYIQYKLENYPAAEKSCFDIIGQIPYDYWLAKTFILLSDIYVKTNNIFQAKHTLQSILENYKGEDLLQIATEKLKIITDFEKLEEQKKQEELLKNQDQQQKNDIDNVDNK